MSTSWKAAVLGGVLVLLGGCHLNADREVQPVYRMTLREVGDTVIYLQRARSSTIMMRSETDTTVTSSERADVVHVTRVSPDTLLAVYEHIRLRTEMGGNMHPVDLRGVENLPFYLTKVDGRMTTVREPEVEQGAKATIRSMARQLEDLFLTVPDEPLVAGLTWVDTVYTVEDQDSSHMEQTSVLRYEVLGDTVVLGIPAKVVHYETAVDMTMRSTAGAADSMRSRFLGGEEGTVIYSSGQEIILAASQHGRLGGELVVVEGETTHRVPRSFEMRSTIELLPPESAAAAVEATGSRSGDGDGGT